MMFRIMAMLQEGWDMLKYVILAVAAVVLAIGVALAMIRKPTDPDKITLVK